MRVDQGRVRAMVTVHVVVGVAVIAVCAGAAILGFVSYRRERAGTTVAHVLALAQTALIAQAGLGLLLLSDGRRAPDRLHYAYGAFALGVALSPWFYAPEEGAKRLLWFAGTTLLAGALAVRAFTTGGDASGTPSRRSRAESGSSRSLRRWWSRSRSNR